MPETRAPPLALLLQDKEDDRMFKPRSPDRVAAPLVLLAGDLPRGTAELLSESGCRVLAAPSGSALLRMAVGTPLPRLILLGGTVGDRPGLSILSRLRVDATVRAIPVLFIAAGDDEEQALALGASECLRLPLRPLALLARVQAQLRLAALADVTGLVIS